MTELENRVVFKKLTLWNYFLLFNSQLPNSGEITQNTKIQNDESFSLGCYVRPDLTLHCVFVPALLDM